MSQKSRLIIIKYCSISMSCCEFYRVKRVMNSYFILRKVRYVVTIASASDNPNLKLSTEFRGYSLAWVVCEFRMCQISVGRPFLSQARRILTPSMTI